MSKLELKIGFNGEQKELIDKVANYNYFNLVENSFVTTSSYNGSDGLLSSENIRNIPVININQLQNVSLISFELYYNYKNTPQYVKLNNVTFKFYTDDNTYISLSNDYLTEELKSSNTQLYSYNLSRALYDNGITSISENDYVSISFLGAVPSNGNESYTTGYIKIKFTEQTSYLTYSNDTFDNVEFIRKIESERTPQFTLNQADGEVNVIDKNLYIQERIKTNQINNYFLTKVLYNGKQLGKFIGVDGSYPYSSKTLSYTLDDYISLLEDTPCEDYYYYKKEPNIDLEEDFAIIYGGELYKELKNITISHANVHFENLTEKKLEYLNKISFISPYIKCSNLKELWEAFLSATMTNLYVNEVGNIDLDVFIQANQNTPIIIKQENYEQNINLNLLPNNAISQVSIKTKYYSDEVITNSNDTIIINRQNGENLIEYSDLIKNYDQWLTDNNVGTEIKVYKVKEPSLFFNFYQKVDFIHNSDSTAKTATYLLAESFVDLGENLYQTINILGKTNFSVFLQSNFVFNKNIENNYNIIWLKKEEYANLNLLNMSETTIYFNSEEYLTKTGRLFKTKILLRSIPNDNVPTPDYKYIMDFELKVVTNKMVNGILTYGEKQRYKNDFIVENNNLFYTDSYQPVLELSFLSKADLDNYDKTLLKNWTYAIVRFDEEQNYKRTIYMFIKSDVLSYWTFVGIDKTSRYEDYKPLSLFVAEMLQNIYNNGRKSITFYTSSYDFLNEDGIIVYKAQNGDILKVGDLIKLPSVSETKFKIINVSSSYNGGLTLKIVAVEYNNVLDFEYSYQQNDTLIIKQTYLATQNNDVLEIE